jgi:threonine dehydrogenase-like Zn-dependent dehydrogenase
MEAVVLSLAREIALEERPVPEPGAGQVLVRPSLVGICGTDLHASELQHFTPGVVMGHEFSATVAALGGGTGPWTIGARVVVNPNGNVCGRCGPCLAGRFNLCHVAVFEAGIGVHRDGGMAPFAVVDARVLHAVPDNVTDEKAAFVEPLATAVRAVGRAEIDAGASVLILGGGPIGLLALQVSRRKRPGHIDLVERVAHRRALATRLGADAVFASVGAARVRPAPDVVIECSGSPAALGAALRLVAPGGRVVVVGIPVRSGPFAPFDLIGKEVEVRGSIIYVDEFDEAIHLLATGAVEVESLISAIEPLRRFHAAFEALHRPEACVKVLLRP